MNQTIIKVTDLGKGLDDEARVVYLNAAHILSIRRAMYAKGTRATYIDLDTDEIIVVEEPIDEILAQVKAGGVA